ncbi:NADH-quinone oxidoreductase subunit J [Cellulomonas fimi]|uniref:NADH-quinone oxidoreductase subunit J n=1 Tax=Cellulomonas fimi TaxID=1708 RepID=A0A7Y0LWT6_CELFI|nr:NADH-quinone oxidoreductase subunit J [Cellulomonas fimi]NMR18808.1 NADH-quinone oxidoreductase subunit J [Cellulomonas fimi]
MTASPTTLGALQGVAAAFTDAGQTSTGEAVLFWVLAPLMVLGALGLLLARRAIYGAMGIVFVMISLAVLYIAQEAPFLGVVQVVVYTGAIMMLFLFVLMLVGVDASDSLTETLRGQRWVGVIFGVGLAAVLIAAVTRVTYPAPTGLAVPNADSNPVGVARIIFGDFIFAFEVVGVLLITAAVGALVLTHRQRLTRRIGQKERSDSRVARLGQGEHLAPLPAPGVFARTNAMDVPALDPYGEPIGRSVSRVLRVRGQEREFEEFAAGLDDEEGGGTVGVPLPPAGAPGETTGPTTTITTGRGSEVQP